MGGSAFNLWRFNGMCVKRIQELGYGGDAILFHAILDTLDIAGLETSRNDSI